MRRLSLVIALAATAVLAIPSAASAGRPTSTPNDTYRIQGMAVTTPVITGTCPDPLPPGPPPTVPIEVTVTGTGTVSRLGDVTIVTEETGLGICIGAPVPAPVVVLTAVTTFTAENGDQLFSTMASSTPVVPLPDEPLLGFTTVDRLTGGTGRMAGASGSLAATVSFDPTATPVTAQLAFSGTVTLPKI